MPPSPKHHRAIPNLPKIKTKTSPKSTKLWEVRGMVQGLKHRTWHLQIPPPPRSVFLFSLPNTPKPNKNLMACWLAWVALCSLPSDYEQIKVEQSHPCPQLEQMSSQQGLLPPPALHPPIYCLWGPLGGVPKCQQANTLPMLCHGFWLTPSPATLQPRDISPFCKEEIALQLPPNFPRVPRPHSIS